MERFVRIAAVELTNSIEFIGLPVKSMGRVCRLRISVTTDPGESRSIRSVFTMPQHIGPLIMKAMPPNIFRSENPGRCSRINRTLSAKPLLRVQHPDKTVTGAGHGFDIARVFGGIA